jgi:hypothetical protein
MVSFDLRMQEDKGGIMKNIAALTPAIALAIALSAAPVVAQMKDAKPQAAPMSAARGGAMKDEGKPAARKRGSSLASVDARHCLQLATNMAIHQCAEKYRPR